MITDSNVWWLQKKIYIPANAFSGMVNVAQPAAYAQNTGIGTIGSTTEKMTAFNSTSTGALVIVNNAQLAHMFMVPYDLDRRKAIRFRIHCSNGTASSTNTWVLKYQDWRHPVRGLVAGVGTTNTTPGATTLGTTAGTPAAYADATVALDTAIPAHTTSSTANAWEITDIGQINAGSSAANPLTDQSYMLSLLITIAAISNTPLFLGLEVQYSTRKTASPVRNRRGGIRLDDHLGTRWQDGKQEGVTVQTG